MNVTPALPSDAPTIANILTSWVASTPWMPRVHSRTSEQGFARLLVDRGWTSVAREKGRVAGFLSRNDDEVHALYLAPFARGRGIGKQLIDHAKSERDTLSLYTFQQNDGACRFYLREGFTEVQRTMGEGNDENLPDVRFIWRRDV